MSWSSGELKFPKLMVNVLFGLDLFLLPEYRKDMYKPLNCGRNPHTNFLSCFSHEKKKIAKPFNYETYTAAMKEM